MAALRATVDGLREQMKALRRQADDLFTAAQREAAERMLLSGVPHDRLRSGVVALEGSPSQRLRVRRVSVGEPVERPFRASIGIGGYGDVAPDVRELWDRLLEFERRCSDGMLRGLPVTVLDVPGAVVSVSAGTLHVRLLQDPDQISGPVVAIPRFAYAFPERKLRNFGHWLLDCVPLAVALAKVAPEAAFLLPSPLRGFQRSTLALAGLRPEQMLAWNGTPIACRRALVLEGDGRTGGGRPLSPLMELRRMTAAATGTARGSRLIYVSRRDATSKRQWVANELEIEAVFASRGFEILLMADCPLDEQIRIFREAAVVAGISGAGLADIVFAPPGTHVLVLVTESLVRWYASDAGARSLWSTGDRSARGSLAALGDSPRFYPHLAAAFDQTCHTFVSADRIPPVALGSFVDEALARAGQP